MVSTIGIGFRRQLTRRMLRIGLLVVILLPSLALLGSSAVADTVVPATWTAEYYNNTLLADAPGVVRNDASINFDWGSGSPGAGINADNFSVRWTSSVYFSVSQSYNFYATVDDGVRIWVDGSLVLDKWYPQSRTTHTATKWLAAGTHQVRVEYFEATGDAVCIVSIAGAGAVSSAGEIIVDDQSSHFIWGGPSSGWYGRSYGYGSHLYWTWNSYSTQYHWGKWFPYVPTAGNWEAYVYIPSRYHGTKHATYTIYHNGTSNSTVINQNIYYNQWVSLGTYYFAGGAGEYVFLNDVTGETYGTRFVGFDAVKFVRRDGGSPVPPSGCTITPILGFGRIWSTYSSVRAKLGCPTAVEASVWAAEETFQGGYMLWRQDTTFIYALYNSGTWQGFDDTWTDSEPDFDGTIVAPSGLYQPVRGFGKVWRLQPGVRTTLGWGTTEERGFTGSVQPFSGGLMFWSNVQGIFVLYNDGTWQRYY
ncbi:MAG: hypothetical protein A2Y73_00440 [Chloroflexi bacterium RBG_13_56_8]|nr:MAG: hypothetical protein A2Y73_00440 [Chloroflexi bacterium RBG_13_56_8]